MYINTSNVNAVQSNELWYTQYMSSILYHTSVQFLLVVPGSGALVQCISALGNFSVMHCLYIIAL